MSTTLSSICSLWGAFAASLAPSALQDESPPLAVFDDAVAIVRRVHPAPARLVGEEAFEARVAELRSELTPASSDTALAVAILRVLHLVADGHSGLHIRGSAPFDSAYPVRFLVQAGELRVQSVSGLDARALGGLVLRVNGRDVREVRERVLGICGSDTPGFGWMLSAPGLLQCPRIAIELGLVDGDGRMVLDVESLAGEALTLELEPGPTAIAEWTSLEYPAGADEILFLKDRNRPHWVTPLPELGAVYAQYNQVNNGEPTTEAFAAAIEQALEQSGSEKLIVDVRRNGGGNNFRNQPIQHAILKNEVINRPGHLFVLTSPNTFSACVNFCGWLERETYAIFVGEPPGAPPNMYGDASRHELDREGWSLFVSAWHWQESMPWDQRLYIQPYVPARTTVPDMMNGRDPVLQAALDFDDPALVELLGATQPRSHYELDGQQPAVEARSRWPLR